MSTDLRTLASETVTEELDFLNVLAILLLLAAHDGLYRFPEGVPVDAPEEALFEGDAGGGARGVVEKSELSEAMSTRKLFSRHVVDDHVDTTLFQNEKGAGAIALLDDGLAGGEPAVEHAFCQLGSRGGMRRKEYNWDSLRELKTK